MNPEISMDTPLESIGLLQAYPPELKAADGINWEALADEIGRDSTEYLTPSREETVPVRRLDHLRLIRDTARYVQSGESISIQRVTDGCH